MFTVVKSVEDTVLRTYPIAMTINRLLVDTVQLLLEYGLLRAVFWKKPVSDSEIATSKAEIMRHNKFVNNKQF